MEKLIMKKTKSESAAFKISIRLRFSLKKCNFVQVAILHFQHGFITS